MDGRGPGAGVRPAEPAAGGGVAGRDVVSGAAGGAGVGAAAAGAAGVACAGAGVGSAATGSTGAGVLGRTGAAGAAADGDVRMGPGLGTGGRRVPTGLRVAAGPCEADSLPAEEPLDSFSLSRRSTGGSTVEEAERTNSPMSFNIVRTVLLSTPSSFASS